MSDHLVDIFTSADFGPIATAEWGYQCSCGDEGVGYPTRSLAEVNAVKHLRAVNT